jgi:two-component system KDP operon response regulator KdpE
MTESRRLRVLVVDDEASERTPLRRALEAEDHVVTEAATGIDALCAAVAEDVDVALVDIGLPDMSGHELLGRLRTIVPDAHLIVISGSSTEEQRLRCFASGADDFLAKPFSLAEVSARIGALRRRRVLADLPTPVEVVHVEGRAASSAATSRSC